MMAATALLAPAVFARAEEITTAQLKARGFGDGPVQVAMSLQGGAGWEMWRDASTLQTLKCTRVSENKRDCVDASRPSVEELMK
jgi:hypothetical protein